MQIETISNQICELGEGPVWDAERNEICWIDILKGKIHQYSFTTYQIKTLPINEMIGCFTLCDYPNLIFASKSGFGFINRTDTAYFYSRMHNFCRY